MFPNDDVYAWNEPVVTNPVPAATTLMVAAIEELITETSKSVANWLYPDADVNKTCADDEISPAPSIISNTD